MEKASVASDKEGVLPEDFFQPAKLLKVAQLGATSPGTSHMQGPGYFAEGFLFRDW